MPYEEFRINQNLLDEVKRIKRDVLMDGLYPQEINTKSVKVKTINANTTKLTLDEWFKYINNTLKIMDESFGTMKMDFPIQFPEQKN